MSDRESPPRFALDGEQGRNGAFMVARNVEKVFELPSGPFTALTDVTITIRKGEFVAIVGKSGSGKSTLLNMLTGIDRPTRGTVTVDGLSIETLGQRALSKWRGRTVGVIFQFFHLLPTLTIVENVMLPMDFSNVVPLRQRWERAMSLLDRMGIMDHSGKLPGALSAGEQQRTAIARSLANDPPIIVADEPTGNLDSRTATDIMKLFTSLNEEGKTIVMVTHERDVSRFVSRRITLEDGKVVNVREVVHA